MKILFICKYNRYRSRVAEALFNNLNKNKEIEVKSAGSNVTQPGSLIISIAARALKRMRINYNEKQGAVQVTPTLINWADKIVIVAEEVDEEDFPSKKVIKIGFPDAYSSEKETEENVRAIEKAVKKLITDLKSS